jgi:hypothetical protein
MSRTEIPRTAAGGARCRRALPTECPNPVDPHRPPSISVERAPNHFRFLFHGVGSQSRVPLEVLAKPLRGFESLPSVGLSSRSAFPNALQERGVEQILRPARSALVGNELVEGNHSHGNAIELGRYRAGKKLTRRNAIDGSHEVDAQRRLAHEDDFPLLHGAYRLDYQRRRTESRQRSRSATEVLLAAFQQ